jgi:Uma2 family endonuclease
MLAQAGRKYYTVEEYFEFELNSAERHEYIDGDIIPMVGGTPNHNKIILNFAAALNFALKRKPFQVFIAEQRLWIPGRRIYTYPDVMVVHGDLQFQDERKDTIINPVFIAEVLSKSTKAYDQNEKFKAYRTVSTFQEYLLIDQYTMQVEQYVKQEAQQWLFTEHVGAESVLQLSTVPFEIQLADIYDKVEQDV